jgi:putative transposase
MAWGKSLANEGLLAEEDQPFPTPTPTGAPQMTSRSTQAFADRGIGQTFSGPGTPTDNTTCKSWMATLRCESLYKAHTADKSPWEVEEMIDRFIEYYNNDRLHQGLQFVTPTDTRGRRVTIIASRKEGMRPARDRRKMVAYGGTGEIR